MYICERKELDGKNRPVDRKGVKKKNYPHPRSVVPLPAKGIEVQAAARARNHGPVAIEIQGAPFGLHEHGRLHVVVRVVATTTTGVEVVSRARSLKCRGESASVVQ
jgi:hypothetical protein